MLNFNTFIVVKCELEFAHAVILMVQDDCESLLGSVKKGLLSQ